jgi:hypothetical protein
MRMIDYVNRSVPMLANMFEKRMKGYQAMGYSIGDHPATDHKKRSASEPRQIGLI